MACCKPKTGKTPAKAAKAASDNLTAGNIARELGVSDAKVKKAIKELGLEPVEKKGPCSYYARSAMSKIKAAVS